MSDKPQTHRRAVRSFVKRAGRLTTSQQRALEELWPAWGIDYAPELLDLDAVFGRAAPRVLEIGFGNGDSLVETAAGSPETDYLGVEVHEPGVGHCLLGIEAAAITNVRLIMHDALEVLENQIAPGSLTRVNLYFPDPWPKKRHHKRRIVNDSFLALVAGRLVADGTLNIATDWEHYAEHIDETLAASPLFALDAQREHDGSEPLDRPATKFERRGLKLGHRIHDWRFRRV
jgi:tRNA (guanine-N7-)-methyltransferase